MGRKPILGPLPSPTQKQPVAKKASTPRRWVFSFRFFKQIEFFGLDKARPTWFVSLLDRLAELSSKTVDEIRADPTAKQAWRYHDIDWDQKNIPINRSDLGWIDSDYRDNPTEYPLVQIQISKALGRVVGFWDESDVFNLILLDPLHNLQPSSFHNYRVDPCSPLSCEYTLLLLEIQKAKVLKCSNLGCPVQAAVELIPSFEPQEVVVFGTDQGTVELIHTTLASSQDVSVSDLVGYGALAYSTAQGDEQDAIAPASVPPEMA